MCLILYEIKMTTEQSDEGQLLSKTSCKIIRQMAPAVGCCEVPAGIVQWLTIAIAYVSSLSSSSREFLKWPR